MLRFFVNDKVETITCAVTVFTVRSAVALPSEFCRNLQWNNLLIKCEDILAHYRAGTGIKC